MRCCEYMYIQFYYLRFTFHYHYLLKYLCVISHNM